MVSSHREISRRRFLTRSGIVLGGAALAPALPDSILRRVGGGLLVPAAHASPGVVLDPQNPGANFTRDGGQTYTAGTVLTLTDGSVSDFITFIGNDPDAAPGTEVDLVATFQVKQTNPAGAYAGNRLVINDGLAKAAIAACVFKEGGPGLGLLSLGSATDPNSYPVFVPVDWMASTSVRLRRTATGDAEIVEVNGAAPTPRALLPASLLPGRTRPGATVEFGCSSVEGECTVEYAALRSEKVVQPVAGTLSFTNLRLRDPDSSDRVQLRADYALGSLSDGINPAAEPVTIRLSTPAGGQFYPSPDFNPLIGFDVHGSAPRRRWTLNDSERARTAIEQLVIDEDPKSSGAVSLRDASTLLATADYSTVDVEISIGTGTTRDRLTGTANLVQKPAGSGSWRLAA